MEFLQAMKEIINTVGVPVACLIGLGAGIYLSARFLASKILEPLVVAHIKFLASVLELLQHVPVTQREHSVSLAKIEAMLTEHEEDAMG